MGPISTILVAYVMITTSSLFGGLFFEKSSLDLWQMEAGKCGKRQKKVAEIRRIQGLGIRL